MLRRRVFAAGLASALVLSVGLFAQTDKKAEEALKKADEAVKKEGLALSKLADAALAARGGSNDFNVTWIREDFLRAPEDKQQFVPFTITLDPAKVTGDFALYWRVVPTPAAVAAADTGKKNDKLQVKPVTEGVSLVTVANAKNPMRLSRSFIAPAGSHDVYVVAKELQVEKSKNAPPPKMVVFKQTVNVPDFWNSELAASSVIVYQSIGPLAAPLTPQQVVERPYVMGNIEIVPFVDLKLSRKSELSMLLFVYNTKGDGANKPDITIEYNFCQTAPGNQPQPNQPCKAGEKFFNKTQPQVMNGQTLPPAFDLSMGHQLQTGQAVPLAGFPEGDYRLEIKVTDKLANKSVTRDVNFTVTAS